MKPFLPFLLVPALSLGGWGISFYASAPDKLALPTVLALDAPPALGVVIPANDEQGPVRVPVDVLLPPVVRAAPVKPRPVVVPLELPKVAAILVNGPRKVAQIHGAALTVGESHGLYRVVAIDNHRVQFEHPGLPQKTWVEVLDR
jgi:hypothetical protein